MQYLNPTTDFAFKKIFGSPESEDILLSFLNAVLGFQSPWRLAKVTIQDPYLAPKIMGMKDSFVDVRATDEQGKHYVIEMQVLPVISFEQRVLYNACKKYAGQIKKGDDYRLLNDVIALTVTDFVMFEHTDMVSKFKLRDESGRDYSDDLELIFVELPKFTKQENNLSDMLDKWCYFLRYAQDVAAVPGVLAQEPPIEHAFVIANRASLSEEELDMQERREMFIQDQRGALEKAVHDGKALGLEEGKVLGLEEGKVLGLEQGKVLGMEQGARTKAIDIAQNMKALGIGNEQIAQLTGLSADEVAKLVDPTR
jgi:predicted transposase/invertase (TIGR01784 family)